MNAAAEHARSAAECAPPEPILSDPHPGAARWALHALYDLIWLLVILLAAPWWLWRCASDARFRGMAWMRLGRGLPPRPAPGGRRRVLVHGVSVGEVKGAQALVRALAERRPDLELVVSTTTYTGFEVARRLYPDLHVVRFPLDLSCVVRRFLARIAPQCVVLVELEIWPSFLRCANRAGIPLAVVNGRITRRSFARYSRFKHLLPQFDRVSLLCVQDEEYAARFRALSADPSRILVSGNIKVDGLRTAPAEPRPELRALLGPRPGQAVIVAGSTHEPEEQLLVRAWRVACPQARLILVPRHPERARELERALAVPGPAPQLLTRLRAGERPDTARPALVDTIGELEQVYALADLVFVGGSLMPHGGQNLLEPAAQGRAVISGPHLTNFLAEAALLERHGAARILSGPEQLPGALAELLADPARRARMGAAGRAAVESQRGATARTLEALLARCLEA